MTRLRIKGFKIYIDNRGKRRCYHRASGQRIDLAAHPIGSPSFLAEVHRIVSAYVKTAGKAGTLAGLIADYQKSIEWRNLAPSTRLDYQKAFDYLKPVEHLALVSFTRATIVKIRDRAFETRKRKMSCRVRAVLSLLFAWGVERDYVKANPVTGVRDIRRERGAARANRPWTDAERDAVLAEAPPHLLCPIAMCMFTALREGDALSLMKPDYDGHTVKKRTNKTGKLSHMPVAARLRAIMNQNPQHDQMTLFATSRGDRWTESGFRASWRKLKLRLEAEGKIEPGLTIHGLRHSFATIARQGGMNKAEIADALAQDTEGMAGHYSREADLSVRMAQVIDIFDAYEAERLSSVGQKSV